jgi:deoxyadenosine/deoxycytidine kinase
LILFLQVSVEGNIGSGKSTLLKYFDDSPYVEALREPVDLWTNLKGHNALELLYKDPARWSFSFNNYALLTRLEMHMKKTVSISDKDQ